MPSVCSPSHENATWVPSGDSVGVTSEPAVVVSGTMRGVAGRASRGAAHLDSAITPPAAITATRTT
jgi:hypothetical protein